ncbi:MAG: hypothetical protein J6S38_08275, partial [Erysipelotrichaceae bacterium]|nr:hypothetical protein [Erysipelotrichaceae bacterium]
MLLINEVKLPLNEDEGRLKEIIEKRLRCRIRHFEIHRKSLDARKDPHYVYSIIAEVDHEERYIGKNVSIYKKEDLSAPYKKRDKVCAVIGYGPSGIFSACRLVEAGFRVIVFEKGKRIKEREKDVQRFFEQGILDPESNVQFGEGGAGTFSDAKLTTRIKDRYIEYILDILVAHGADPSIKYENHAHIGTDEIRKIIARITDDLTDNGVEFHFEEEMKDLILDEQRKITKLITSKGEYDCDLVLLGIGHSAYKTVELLKKKGVYIEKKDISIGFRVEHPQSLIDERQTDNLVKQANEYFLRYKEKRASIPSACVREVSSSRRCRKKKRS